MPLFLKNNNYIAVWLSTVLIILYFIAFYIFGYAPTKFITDLAALTFLTFISTSTVEPAFKALSNGLRTGVEKFIFSYWFIWTLVLLHRVFAITVGILGRPDNLMNGPIPGLLALGFAIAAAHGIAAPLNGTDKLQRREIITIAIASVISGTILGMAIGVFVIAGWVNQ